MIEKDQKNKSQSAPSQDTGISESKNESRKNTSLRLDQKTLKSLKIIAIEKETSIQKLIESLIEEYLEKDAQGNHKPS
jgi:predicted DNA-binding ribbon-helix-helix protein